MTTTPSHAPRYVSHDDGEVHAVMGDPMRFIMTAAHSGGGYAFAELEVRPDNGAPPHIHHNEEEAFYILEGTITATVDGTKHRLNKGDFIHMPRGAVRSFTNPTEANSRLLILHCPGSASEFYIGMGKLPYPPDLNDVKALADQHGIEMVL